MADALFPNRDWEQVSKDGTIKRFAIPGGWIYATYDWVPPMWVNGEVQHQGYWHMVGSFFIPSAAPRFKLERKKDA